MHVWIIYTRFKLINLLRKYVDGSEHKITSI